MKVYTIIVTYNGQQWIKSCISSLKKNSFKSEILIVDNCSIDTTVDLIETNFPEVLILKQRKNLGFGKANNIGMSYALNDGADAVFLLNQDTTIETGTLKRLVTISLNNKVYGVLSPIHLNWEGTQLEYYFDRFAAKSKQFYSDYLLKKKLNAIYEVPFVNAAAWLIPASTLKLIGGFDPLFLHYGEDNNYCQRLQYHQLKIGIVPNSFIKHDSKIRKRDQIELFIESYYQNEIKQWQLKLGDINKETIDKEIFLLKRTMQKQLIRNLLQFNFAMVKGYLKKYKIFGNELLRIKKSIELNKTKGAHYLNQ